MKDPSTPAFFLGIDVGKDELHAHLIASEKQIHQCAPNTPSGRKSLLAWLKKHSRLSKCIACMEHTGIYGKDLTCDLHEVCLCSLFVVNPRQVKAFGEQKLRRNKTGSADAKLIAEFIQKEHADLHPWEPKSPRQQDIQALCRFSQKLVQGRAKLETQAQSTGCPPLKETIESMLRQVESDLRDLHEKIDSRIAGDESLSQKMALPLSIPGIGEHSARVVLSEVPDVHCFESARQLAAWTGVTPRHFQSGTSVNKRTSISKVGNARLRRALYFPAMSAMSSNSLLETFANRLRKNGKTGQQIVIALIRKLLHIIYGILKSNTPFNPHHLNPNTPTPST